MEHRWVPIELKMVHILGKYTIKLRFLVFCEEVSLQIEMTLIHLNMYEVLLI